MRYIDLRTKVETRITDVWREKAQQALDDVASCGTNEERAKKVNDHADVWQLLKDILLDAMGQKCWYCESKQIRSDNNVDHFRPKNSVYDCDDHPGYWWLAFDWQNYRLSCTYCNSRRRDKVNNRTGGKQDYFPLLNPESRVYEPDDDIRVEQPKLLDPTKHSDPGLIWFFSDGTAVPKWAETRNTTQCQRAECSIELYHLNHVDLKERRQELCNYIGRLIQDGSIYYREYLNGDPDAWHAYERVIEELSYLVDETAEYSATGLSMIMDYSKKFTWVDAVLVA